MIIVKPISLSDDQIRSIVRAIPIVIELHKKGLIGQPVVHNSSGILSKIISFFVCVCMFTALYASEAPGPYWNGDYMVIWYTPTQEMRAGSTQPITIKPRNIVIPMQGDYEQRALDEILTLRQKHYKIIKVVNVNHTLSTTFCGGKDTK